MSNRFESLQAVIDLRARIAELEAENERLRDEAYHKAKLAVVGDYADRIAELEALLERYSPDWRIAFEKP